MVAMTGEAKLERIIDGDTIVWKYDKLICSATLGLLELPLREAINYFKTALNALSNPKDKFYFL